MRSIALILLMGIAATPVIAQTNNARPASNSNNNRGNPPQKSAFQSNPEAYGPAFTAWSKTRTAPIGELRGSSLADGTQLSPEEVRQRIAAAVSTVRGETPKKPRKLLLIESLAGMYHNPGIPECNIMIELLGKTTGAWTTELNNDLSNLTYEKIKQYDAVFINSAVGEMFPDPAVREGLTRFVREGGGLGGIHGTPWASRDWDEFAEMIGSQSAPHRIENGVLKVYDPKNPIVRSFGGKDLPHVEEYYRFEHEGRVRLRWDKVRVLMTVDLDVPQRSEWTGYKRPDNVYPVTWVLSYGAGRSFYCSLGHRAETFMRPEIVAHIHAGIQFILGDLEVDTTPNPLPATATQP